MVNNTDPFETQVNNYREKREDIDLTGDESSSESSLGDKRVIEESGSLFSQDYTGIEDAINTITPSRINEKRFIDLAVLGNMEGSSDKDIKDVACERYGRNSSSVRNTLERFREDNLVTESNTLTEKGELARHMTEEAVAIELEEVPPALERVYQSTLEQLGLEDNPENREIVDGAINDAYVREVLEDEATDMRQREAAENAASVLSGFKNGKTYIFEVVTEKDGPKSAREAVEIVNSSNLPYIDEINQGTASSQLSGWKDYGLLESTGKGYQPTEKGKLFYNLLKKSARELNMSEKRVEMREKTLENLEEDRNFVEEASTLKAIAETETDRDRIDHIKEAYSPVAKYMASKDSDLEYDPIEELQ